MSIEKVKLLGIKGNSRDLDRFLANVLFNSDVQIEDAKKIYNKGWKLEYFEYDYKIKETLKRCENLLNKLKIQYTKDSDMVLLENKVEDISNKIDEIEQHYDECVRKIVSNEKENEDALEKIEIASRLENIDIDMKKLYDLQYIKFERELLPDDLVRTPKEYLRNLDEQIKQRNKENNEANSQVEKIKKDGMTKILSIYRELQTYDKINTIKKYIVHDQNGSFYVVAWVPEVNLKKMEKKLDGIPDIDYVVRDGENPPTKLKNNKIIKPFEELVKMYGMPRMDELDPTWFVALTTFIMFGFMFGDVGHRISIFNFRNNITS